MDKLLENISKSAIALQSDDVTRGILTHIVASNIDTILANNIVESQFVEYFSTSGSMYFKIFILQNNYDALMQNDFTNVIMNMINYFINVFINKITIVDILKNASDSEKKYFNDFTLATLDYCKTQRTGEDQTCISFIESTKPGGVFYNYNVQQADGSVSLSQDLFTNLESNTCWNPLFSLKNPSKCKGEASFYIILIIIVITIIISILKWKFATSDELKTKFKSKMSRFQRKHALQ